MGVEVLDAEFTQVPVKDVIKEEGTLVNDKDSEKLKQESENQGVEDPKKSEGDAVTNTNFPKDAVDEWPAPKQIHSFYFVKYRPYEDPKTKLKIDQLEKDLQKKNQARFQLVEALRAKKSERQNLYALLKPLGVEDQRYRMVVDDKRKEMEPLHEALGKLRGTNNANRERGERGVSLCSSEEELNDAIHRLNYRIQHESNTLVEEKQLLRDIKQLEGTREKVIANAAMKAKIQDALGPKEDIQDQVKLIGLDLDGVRKEKQAVRGKIKALGEALDTIKNEISSMEVELTALTEKRDKTKESISELRSQRDGGNECYYQNRTLLNDAKTLAANKKITDLENLCHTEGEKFISRYSSDKSFRKDYEKRILPSLDMRQLSRDGRMRNPDEKPLVAEAPAPAEPEIVSKGQTKRTSDSKPPVQHEAAPVKKAQKEDNNKLAEKKTSSTQVSEAEDKENIITLEKPQKEPSPTNAVDTAKLKEMKREEEIAKAKLAVERKKKLAEKAAAKAAIRAEKEAEKKLKEREKKAKKKAAASAPCTNPEEQTEADAEAIEPESSNVSVEAPVSSKKEQKENTMKYRSRGKGQDPLPKIILKRKKATPYWVWAAPAAALFFAFVGLGYYFLL